MTSLLEELGAKIASEIAEVAKLLKANGSPSPSFAESSAVNAGASVDSSDEQAPVDLIVALAYAATDTANLNTVVRFNIPQNVPFHSTISLSDLAAASCLSEDVLTRTVRFAITNGIFSEPSPGQIGHSAASATLARNKNSHDMTLFNSGFSSRIVVSIGDTLKAQHDKAPGAPAAAFNLAFPGYENLFEYMGKNVVASEEYYAYLDGRSELPLYAVTTVAKAWDWASLGSGTVVDVGGSSGHTSLALARQFSQLQFVVQDINQAGLNLGRELIAHDADLQKRVTYILHDWGDEDCVKIIKGLLPAMNIGSRVILSEGVIPEPPSSRSALMEDKQTKFDDYIMLGAHNARERSIAQYTKLFQDADPRFSLDSVSESPAGVYFTIVAFILNSS